MKRRINPEVDKLQILCSIMDMPAGPESRAGLKLPQERLSPEVLAQEVDGLVVFFKTILARKEKFPPGVTYQLDESPYGGLALRVSQNTSEGVKSAILVRRENKGGIHFIETRKSYEPEVHGHTRLAVKKVEDFLQSLT